MKKALTIPLVLILLLSAAGYMAWDYYVPHTAYFADYILRLGAPEGVLPLTKTELEGRSSRYALVRERGHVREVRLENAAGRPVPHENGHYSGRPAISIYHYHEDGQIIYVEYADANRKVLSTLVYTSDLKAADLQISGGDSFIQTLSAFSTGIGDKSSFSESLMEFKSDITRHQFEYDERG